VTYRRDRGEPRMSVKKAIQLRRNGEPAGDCIDCLQCVNVCPTGGDIRTGIQLCCIQCGLCIDACDNIMRQVHRPTGLIAYDTDINAQLRLAGRPPAYRLIRARTIMYAAIILVVGVIMLYALATRTAIQISVMHERNPLAVMLSDGGVRNDYTVRLLNRSGTARSLAIDVAGLPGATLQTAGIEHQGRRLIVDVGQDQTQEIRLSVKVDQAMVPAQSTRITILASDVVSGQSANASDHFMPANNGVGGLP